MGIRRGLAALAVLAATVLGAGSDGAEAKTEWVIVTEAFQYVPPDLHIQPGDSVTYANLDPLAPHNVVSSQGGPDGNPLFESDTLSVGERGPVRGVDRLQPGVYPFICTLHAQMRGTLFVEEPAETPRPVTSVVAGAGVPTPTSMAFHDDALYVASHQRGAVYRLSLLAGGLLGPPQEFATGLNDPLGVAFAPDGTMFVSDSHAAASGRTVGRVWAMPPGGGSVTAAGAVVVDGLPNGVNATNGLAVHAGRLYITNGTSTEDGVSGGPPDGPLSGTLLSVAVGARNLTPADAEPDPNDPTKEPPLAVEARGFRNPYDLAFRPGTDEAWIPTNGPSGFDPLGEDLLHRAFVNGPALHYGFPACLYEATPFGPRAAQNPKVAATTVCGAHTPPEATLGLHVSADGAAFGPADDFWDRDLFIAEFGGTTDGGQPAGRQVVRVPVDADGRVEGAPQTLVAGVAPLDLTFGPAGTGLYVADFATGVITLVRPAPQAEGKER